MQRRQASDSEQVTRVEDDNMHPDTQYLRDAVKSCSAIRSGNVDAIVHESVAGIH